MLLGGEAPPARPASSRAAGRGADAPGRRLRSAFPLPDNTRRARFIRHSDAPSPSPPRRNVVEAFWGVILGGYFEHTKGLERVSVG